MDADNMKGSLAIEIMEGRKFQNTKNQYWLEVEHFQKWLQAKHPKCLTEDGTINLPEVNKVILREFLGHTCKKKDKSGAYVDPIVYHTFQHVSGYKSAIKDYYSNMDVL
jgi:hypothetical protein